jgi:DNA-binding NtrC family response regulator
MILLVDDDAHFRGSLMMGLEDAGCMVCQAKDGEEALALLKDRHREIQCIVADAKMPGLDGFWLADQVQVGYPHIQVVILSAFPYPQGGPYHILQKPIPIRRLVEVLDCQSPEIGVLV